MAIERLVAAHYARPDLESAILAALAAHGADPTRLRPDDLAMFEEFHVGGRQATADLAAQMQLAAGQRVLDIGSGIGGPARYLARTYGCHVTGIDLTEAYVAVAAGLTRRLGEEDKVCFRHGSALDLPFDDASFDAALMVHVGMNIADKTALFAGVRRVLRPGGVFAVYDVMRTGAGDLDYPLPWASMAETSFLASPAAYCAALAACGFTVTAQRDRRDFAVAFFQALHARLALAGAALGQATLMGPDAAVKVGNLTVAIDAATVAPVELLARAA